MITKISLYLINIGGDHVPAAAPVRTRAEAQRIQNARYSKWEITNVATLNVNGLLCTCFLCKKYII